jgi:hypothetical protein
VILSVIQALLASATSRTVAALTQQRAGSLADADVQEAVTLAHASQDATMLHLQGSRPSGRDGLMQHVTFVLTVRCRSRAPPRAPPWSLRARWTHWMQRLDHLVRRPGWASRAITAVCGAAEPGRWRGQRCCSSCMR